MLIFDVHSHRVERQSGGFILSIENQPIIPGGQTFETLSSKNFGESFIVVRYVQGDEVSQCARFTDNILYIHFRRENIKANDLVKFLLANPAKLVILDTFSKFRININEYKYILNTLPEKYFLLAHGGGYEMLEFVQLARYSTNCFIDFSATQSIFNFNKPKNEFESYLRGLFWHCFSEPRLKNKVVFGSDNPEFNQNQMIDFYQKNNLDRLVNENYLSMLKLVG